MKVYFNGQLLDGIAVGTTLRQLVINLSKADRLYTVNGEAPASADLPIPAYGVIEENAAGIEVRCAASDNLVDVHIADFKGFSGGKRVPKFVKELETQYNQPVKVSVIRDAAVCETETLQAGDRVMITPAGGVKGA